MAPSSRTPSPFPIARLPDCPASRTCPAAAACTPDKSTHPAHLLARSSSQRSCVLLFLRSLRAQALAGVDIGDHESEKPDRGEHVNNVQQTVFLLETGPKLRRDR